MTSVPTGVRPTCPNPRAQEYRAAGLYTAELLWQPLAAAAEHAPEDVALVDEDTRLTFAEYWLEAQRVAAGLRALGVRPRSAVVYQLQNWWEQCVLHYAIVLTGAVAVPLVTAFRAHEIRHIIGQLRPAAIVGADSDREPGAHPARISSVLRECGSDAALIVARPIGELPNGAHAMHNVRAEPDLAEPAGDAREVCTVIYTSGSTSDPKGVLHTHESLLYDARTRVSDFNLTAADVIFMPSSLAHVSGLSYGVHLGCLLRSKVALLDRWSPADAIDLIEREGATITNGATLMLRGIVDEYIQRRRSSSLRVFACGGSDVSEPLIREAQVVLDAYVTRAYGCSEAPTLTWGRPGDDPNRVASTNGRAIGAAELRVVDDAGTPVPAGVVGECEAIGPERCVGYVDAALNDAGFRLDGWVRTGDWVSIDADGYLSVHGRKKDIIVRAGENISAQELERILLEHDSIRNAAVVATPDERLGERAYAFVEVRDHRPMDLAAVRVHFERRGVAKIKWPEFVEVIDDLPRTGAGKVDKKVLRSLAAAHAERGDAG